MQTRLSPSTYVLTILTIFTVVFLDGCHPHGSVADLYKFQDVPQAAVQVQVGIDFTLNGASASLTDLPNRQFILNAYALDAGGAQVEIGIPPAAPVMDMPISLMQTTASFPVAMQIQPSVQPGPSGYAVHFVLRDVPTSPSLTANSATTINGMRGGIQAGAASTANSIELSFASNVAYQLTSGSLGNLASSSTQTSYQSLLNLLHSRQSTVGAQINQAQTALVDTYCAGATAGLENQILSDTTFQASLAQALTNTAASGVQQDSGATSQFATGFNQTLLAMATDIQATLAQKGSGPASVYKSGALDTTALPDPTTLTNAVLTPAVKFTDTDPTAAIGGTVQIAAPPVSTGITSYNIYLGGSTKAGSRSKLLGSVNASGKTTFWTLTAGTGLPTGDVRIWVYPVAAGSELSLPGFVTIVNAVAVPPAAFTLTSAVGGDTEITVTWTSSAQAQSYQLLRGTASGSYPVVVSSNATSPFVDSTVINGNTYYYMVVAASSSLTTKASAELSATPHWPIRMLGGTGQQTMNAGVATDSQHNIYVTGRTATGVAGNTRIGSTDAYLVKYSSLGVLQWSKEIGAATCNAGGAGQVSGGAITIDSTDAIYVGGTTCADLGGQTLNGALDTFVMKYDASGTLLWTRLLGVSGQTTRIGRISHDASDHLLIGGTTNGALSGEILTGIAAGYAAKYSSDGTRQWTRLICGASGSNPDLANVQIVYPDISGGVIAAGVVYASVGNSIDSLPGASTLGGAQDAFLIKYDATGNVIWTKEMGAAGASSQLGLNNVVEDASGNIYTAGPVLGTGVNGNVLIGNSDRYIEKFDPNGNILWAKESGVPGANIGVLGLAIDSAGSLYMAGSTTSSLDGQTAPSGTSGFLTKFDSTGDVVWTSLLIAPNSLTIAVAITFDWTGSILVTGYTAGDLGGVSLLPTTVTGFLASINPSGLR